MFLKVFVMIVLGMFSLSCALSEDAKLSVKIYNIELGKSTFSDVIKYFGNNYIQKEGQDSDLIKYMCYYKNHIFIKFISNSMGAGKYIIGVEVDKIKNYSHNKNNKCVELKGNSYDKMLFNKKIGVGSSREDFEKYVKVKPKSEGQSLKYSILKKRGKFDVLITYVLGFGDDSKIKTLNVYKVTSY